MLLNYLKIFIRNLSRYKTHHAINIFSLAFALAVSIAIFSWVRYQISFDKFHNDSDRIYRFVYKGEEAGRTVLPAGYKNFVFNNVPEIKNSIRLFDPNILGSSTKIEIKTKIFTTDKILYSDPEFFKIFSFQLTNGDENQVLSMPNSVVITEETAKKYYGENNPIGETLLINDKNELVVTGVVKNIPDNSHFQFDLLATMDSSPFGKNYKTMGFGSAWVFYNYVKVTKNISIPELEEKVKNQAIAIKEKYPHVEYKNFAFQPLLDIHLRSFDQFELGRNIDIKYVYLFSFIGIMILIIAAINYINLSLAYSGEQAKNIGIQKVLGAEKKQIIQQFIFNSMVVSLISILLAWIFWELFAPIIAAVSDNLINNTLELDTLLIIFLLLITIFLGIVTGFFPAFLLSKFEPTQIFRGDLLLSGKNKSGTFRKILVTFQFIISISLIIATIVIYQQMQYMQSKELGYNKEQVVVLPIEYSEVKNNINVFKNNLMSHSSILGVSSVSQLPCEIKSAEGVIHNGKRYTSYYITVDKDFFSTMNIELLKGVDQIKLLETKPITDWQYFQNKFVINEQLLQEMGLSVDEALNEQLIIKHGNMLPGPIIGIVKDFHFESLHNNIEPLVIEFDSRRFRFLLIHINSDHISNTIDYIKTQWQSIANGIPFEFNFLDRQYDNLYKTETQMGKIILIFSVIAILIASLGLFGLSLFSINKRTKEIGIRKVLGGSVQSILVILGKELTKWVLIANIIAWPLAWIIMNSWMQNFAYKTSIELWVFILAGGIALLIAVATVSIQSIRAALSNPVESLRYE